MEHWLHVFATFAIGGPQRRAIELIEMAGPGVRHTVVAMDGRSDCAALVDAGARLDLRAAPTGGCWRRLRSMVALQREIRPDLLLTYNWGAIEWLLAARWARVCPVVHHEDGFGPEESQRFLRRRIWARRVLAGVAQSVVVPSRRLEAIGRQLWRVDAARLRYLPNGVDVKRFAPQPYTHRRFEVLIRV